MVTRRGTPGHGSRAAEAIMAQGASVSTPNADAVIIGPDIAANCAVVPIGASATRTSLEQLAGLVEKNPSELAVGGRAAGGPAQTPPAN